MALLFMASTPSAAAQASLDALFDAGGVRLNQAQVVQVLVGTTWLTAPEQGELTYAADGTFKGFIANSSAPGVRGFFGTWTVDNDGRLCQKYAQTRALSQPLCFFWFKLDERYFGSGRMADRPAAVFPLLPKP